MKEKILNYIGQDGLLHILCSIVLVRVIDIFFPLWVAIIATVVIGLAKELIWDKWLGKGTFDKKDLLCDLTGIIIGCM
jgi:hypothetical protein